MAADRAFFITIFSLSATIALGVFVGAQVPRIERHRRQPQAIYDAPNFPSGHGQPPLPYQPVSHISYGPDSALPKYSPQSFFSQQQFEPYRHQDQGRLGGVQDAIRPIQSTIETREQPSNYFPIEPQQIYLPISSEGTYQPGNSQSRISESDLPFSIVTNAQQPTALQPGFTHKVRVTRVDNILPPQPFNNREQGLFSGTLEPNFGIRAQLGCCINGEGPCCGQEAVYQPNRFESTFINTSEFRPLNRGFTGSGAAFAGNIAENYPYDQNSVIFGYGQPTPESYLPTSAQTYPVYPPRIVDRQALQVGVGTPGFWTEWSSWSGCSYQVQFRTRSCDYGKNALANGCLGKAYESIPCADKGFTDTRNELATRQNPTTTNDDDFIDSNVSTPSFNSQAADTVLSVGLSPVQPTIRTYGSATAIVPLGDFRKPVKGKLTKLVL